MRDLCVRTFFSVQENIIQKRKKKSNISTQAHEYMNADVTRGALRVFLFYAHNEKRAKMKNFLEI